MRRSRSLERFRDSRITFRASSTSSFEKMPANSRRRGLFVTFRITSLKDSFSPFRAFSRW